MPSLRPSGRALIAALAVIACGDGTGPAVPADIVIVPNHPTLPQGLTLQLRGTVVDAAGHAIRGRRVTFTSGDTAIAKVTAGGLVTSVGPVSTVRITAEYGGLTNWVDLQVTQRVVGMEVNPPSLVLNTNSTAHLSVSIVDFQGNPVFFPGDLRFVSDNPQIVVVDGFGNVASLGVRGTATITVTVDTFVVLVPVQVTQIPTTLQVTPDPVVLQPGGNQALTTVVLDAVGQPISGISVQYSSNSPTLVSVSPGGLVTSLGPAGGGSITVTGGVLQRVIGVFVGSARPLAVVATTPVPGPAYGSAVGGNGAVVVSLASTQTVLRGNLPSYTLGTEFPASDPLGVAVSPSGATAYVAQRGNGQVAVIDLVNNTVGTPITGLTGELFTVAVSPDGEWLFTGGASWVFKVQLSTGTVVDSIDVPALHLAVHPTEHRVYASAPFGGVEVVEINYDGMTRGQSFAAISMPQSVAISPNGAILYAANEGAATVQSFNLDTGRPGISYATEGGSFGLAASANYLVVCESTSGLIEIFDPASGFRLSRLPIGGTPRRPSLNATGDLIVVPNEGGWVTFIQ